MNQTYLRLVLRALLVALWLPALAFAATVQNGAITIDNTLDQLSWSALLVVWMLSTLSATTALVIRIDRELRVAKVKKLPRPYLFTTAHMLGSWMAGILAFVIGEGQDLNDWVELGFTIAASFVGAKFIEAVAEKFIISHTKALGANPQSFSEADASGFGGLVGEVTGKPEQKALPNPAKGEQHGSEVSDDSGEAGEVRNP